MSDAPQHPSHDGELSAEQIGPYRIIEELGRGGQGLVYLAEDTRLGRKVALKVLTSWGAASEQVVARFRREAAIASKLDHPGICTVYETGTAQGVPYLAMRHVEGESLSEKIATAVSGATTDALSFIDLEDDPDYMLVSLNKRNEQIHDVYRLNVHNGDLTLIPRVGNQKIHFGMLINSTEKLANLYQFYKQAMPVKGWQTYSDISLKYNNQIVCTKK